MTDGATVLKKVEDEMKFKGCASLERSNFKKTWPAEKKNSCKNLLAWYEIIAKNQLPRHPYHKNVLALYSLTINVI